MTPETEKGHGKPATTRSGLQNRLNIAYQYSQKWHFDFNPTKCRVLAFSKHRDLTINVKLGQNRISQTSSEEHLGVCIATTKEEELKYMQKRIRGCKSIVHTMKSIGSHKVPLSPNIASKIYCSVVIPKLVYGMEAMNSNEDVIDELESFHRDNAKMLQGLPKQSANPSGLVTMGWNSIQSITEVVRLQFLWRVLMLPMNNIYKIAMLRRLYQVVTQCNSVTIHSPTSVIVNICSKYGLLDTVFEAIESGQYMSKSVWNKHIKAIIYSRDHKCQMITCKLYRSMHRVNFGSRLEMSSWWKFCTKYPGY